MRRILDERGMTQVELAAKLRVRQPTVAKMLKATKTRPASIAKIAVILKCDVNELFVGVSEDYDEWRTNQMGKSTGQSIALQDNKLADPRNLHELTHSDQTSRNTVVKGQSLPQQRGGPDAGFASSADSPRIFDPINETDAELSAEFTAAVSQLDAVSHLLQRLSAAWLSGEIAVHRPEQPVRDRKIASTGRSHPRHPRRKRGA